MSEIPGREVGEGWDWFNAALRQVDEDRERSGVDIEVLPDVYHQCFSTKAGQVVLKDLQRFIMRVAGFDPNMGFYNGAAFGFYREGQNSMVSYISKMTEGGYKNAEKRGE